MQSAYNEIKQRIESAERGALFFPDDFAAIRKNLRKELIIFFI